MQRIQAPPTTTIRRWFPARTRKARRTKSAKMLAGTRAAGARTVVVPVRVDARLALISRVAMALEPRPSSTNPTARNEVRDKRGLFALQPRVFSDAPALPQSLESRSSALGLVRSVTPEHWAGFHVSTLAHRVATKPTPSVEPEVLPMRLRRGLRPVVAPRPFQMLGRVLQDVHWVGGGLLLVERVVDDDFLSAKLD